jgi:hypothetical protein
MKPRILFVCAVLWIGTASVLAAEAGAKRAIRFDPERTRRPVARHARSVEVPQSLQPGSRGTAISLPDKQPSRAATREDNRQRRLDTLADAARQAAFAAAERRAPAGRREYFRVGFWGGLRAALNDGGIGIWDRREGERDGELDPDARLLGADLARDEADRRARRHAEEQVIGQFSSLENSVAFQPLPRSVDWKAPPVALDPPDLVALMDEFGFERAFTSRHARRHLAGWSWTPDALRRCGEVDRFYDGAWSDPDAAFLDWSRGDPAAGWFRALAEPAERAWVARVFGETFERWVAHYHTTMLAAAHDRGAADGWDYGAFLRSELEYRTGYTAGFARAAAFAARDRFRGLYPELYDEWYAEFHDEWMRGVKPRIRDVTLHDEDGDGVFEPGERVSVAYELENLGGAAGWAPFRLTGDVLESDGVVDVELPARGTIRRRGDLAARIDGATRPRTRTKVAFDLAGDGLEIPLRVAYPLEIDRRSVDVDRDNVAGLVRVELIVENNGRDAIEGRVVLDVRGTGILQERAVGRLTGGSFGRVIFDLEGLQPLALVAGEVSLDFAVQAEGVEQDAYRRHLGDTVRDLTSDDLTEILRLLAQDRATSPRDIRTARDLLMRRLREDWKVAAMGRGNPYKRDLRDGGTRTALGDLLQAVTESRNAMARPEVFDGLSQDVVALSARLPGVHPFLRKAMRRMAAQLP